MSELKSGQVIERVKDMIRAGILKPGDRLPNEDDFANQLGVSRNSMREAVRALSAMQILQARQGDGTYISTLAPENLLGTLSFAVEIAGAQSVLHFLALRRVLEVDCTMRAAATISDEELAGLAEVHARSLVETDHHEMMQLDAEFHDRIARVAGNPVQTALLKLVSSPTMRARTWRGRSEERFGDTIRREHGLILDALRRRDPQAAMVEAYNHVNGVENWVRENLR